LCVVRLPVESLLIFPPSTSIVMSLVLATLSKRKMIRERNKLSATIQVSLLLVILGVLLVKLIADNPIPEDTDQDVVYDKPCEGRTVAYTTRADPFYQIQICPWFLTFAMKQDEIKIFQQAAPTRSLLQRFIAGAKVLYFKAHFAQVDVAAGFEKVLLHELSHTAAGQSLQYFLQLDSC
jgi:hypothetical protein